MEYELLLDVAIQLGYQLSVSGAETFRVEESIRRVLEAYGIKSEIFAIPNCLTVCIETDDNKPMTRMCRIDYRGNDFDSVERYSNLSRRICAETPSPEEAEQWLQQTIQSRVEHKLPMYMIGNFLGAFGFGIFFGGTLVDGLCAGVCGLLIGWVKRLMTKLKVNPFFSTICAAFLMSVLAYSMGHFQFSDNADMVVIGAIMLLMPGLIFTNAMRDIIFGDTNSGINRIVQVIMIASAVSIGTVTAFNTVTSLLGAPVNTELLGNPYWVQCVAALIGCVGFSVLFNIHGPGGLLCALGGFLSWASYCVVIKYSEDEVLACFVAALISALYSESMARIRKFPAISYLVVSIFPLIPGAGIYYSGYYLAHGQMEIAVGYIMSTIALAGAIAVGILLVSTIVRHWFVIRKKLHAH